MSKSIGQVATPRQKWNFGKGIEKDRAWTSGLKSSSSGLSS
ncbi:hypothetical protein [Sorlinia euscelidii]